MGQVTFNIILVFIFLHIGEMDLFVKILMMKMSHES